MADKLRTWQRRNRLKDAEAAAIVHLSISGWRRQRDGLTHRKAQTELICKHWEDDQLLDPLKLAEIAELFNKLLRLSISRRR